ncbi:MAG: 50S ribosomal protein L21 [FCB group bacterium]|nr:50S ribosomal protein L21 [FCB group bacterium]
MYAIASIAGKQFKLIEGQTIRVPRLDSKPGDTVNIEKILIADDGKQIKVGTPVLKNAQAAISVVEHGREQKVLIYKKKRRKGYQRKNGHRQGYTLVKVEKITLSAAKKKATPGPKKAAPETTKEA